MRLPPLDQPSPEQRAFSDHLLATRGRIVGPFKVLAHSPALGRPIEALASGVGAAALPERLRELVLLIAARFWDAADQWLAHVDKARAAGLTEGVIAALAAKQAIAFDAADEAALYAFCRELLEDHFVSQPTYAAARDALGEAGLVDVAACLGTFSMLALLLNAFEVEPKPGSVPPFADLSGFSRTGPRQPLS